MTEGQKDRRTGGQEDRTTGGQGKKDRRTGQTGKFIGGLVFLLMFICNTLLL